MSSNKYPGLLNMHPNLILNLSKKSQDCLFPGVKFFFFSCQTSAYSQQLQGYPQWEDVWFTYLTQTAVV